MISITLNNAGVAVLVVIGVIGGLIALYAHLRYDGSLGDSTGLLIIVLTIFVSGLILMTVYGDFTSDTKATNELKKTYAKGNGVVEVLHKEDGTLFNAQQYLGSTDIKPVIIYDVDSNGREYFEITGAKLRFVNVKAVVLHKYTNTEVK